MKEAKEAKNEQDRKDVFPVPGQENHAITVWVEEDRDGESHWYDFTEEEALKVDFDKAFPTGYVDYYIDIDKDGIIQSDTLSPSAKGTRFTESYPGFRCKDTRYEGRLDAISIEGMKREMLTELQKMAKIYQEKCGVSEEDIKKALNRVRKSIPFLTQEKQQTR